jgi:hypothetical protein|tara:strand:- start:229 stop:483 length:255 start_codon:yes stop_codon:yes gene_type:complete
VSYTNNHGGLRMSEEKPKQEIDSESWQYFHDRVNNKGIVVNTFSYEKTEPQVNVFVVNNPSSNSWHDDMVQIGSCIGFDCEEQE